jgi:hypothetical protein
MTYSKHCCVIHRRHLDKLEPSTPGPFFVSGLMHTISVGETNKEETILVA